MANAAAYEVSQYTGYRMEEATLIVDFILLLSTVLLVMGKPNIPSVYGHSTKDGLSSSPTFALLWIVMYPTLILKSFVASVFGKGPSLADALEAANDKIEITARHIAKLESVFELVLMAESKSNRYYDAPNTAVDETSTYFGHWAA